MGDAPGTFRKLRLMDAAAMGRAIARMAREIVEAVGGPEGFALIGIRTRGVPLAQRIAVEIEKAEKVQVPVGLLDITLYRDDLTTIASSPVLKRTQIDFPVEAKTIVLCDDVLYTGRTVRAAIDGVLDYGRPRRVLLAVLVDRGRRELPIEAQFTGRKIATAASEIVSATFRETDGDDDVWLLDREAPRLSRKGRPARVRKAAAKPKAPPRRAPKRAPRAGAKALPRVARGAAPKPSPKKGSRGRKPGKTRKE